MATKEEEYLRRQRELGYEPSLAGMDDDDLDYVPSWSSLNPDRQPIQYLNKKFVPVDRKFAERIFRMFARPYDSRWKMPDPDGPEYAKAKLSSVREEIPEVTPIIYGPGKTGTKKPDEEQSVINWGTPIKQMFQEKTYPEIPGRPGPVKQKPPLEIIIGGKPFPVETDSEGRLVNRF